MGTRADFYVRKESQMKWLGSIAWDGYPDGIEEKILNAKTESEYESEVDSFLKNEDSATFPDEGWPWPWDDSRTTDYSYIFDNGKVMASCFGYSLFDPLKDKEETDDEQKMDGYFPDMKDVKNVKLGGPGSGLIII
jgi:hypothetical protein